MTSPIPEVTSHVTGVVAREGSEHASTHVCAHVPTDKEQRVRRIEAHLLVHLFAYGG